MLKNLKVKVMLLVVVLIALLFSTNDFGVIGSEKMGIVSAIGIDKKENEYIVTTQIATSEIEDNKSGNQKILSSNGKTILEGINKIGEKTGWTMNLNFLNLIILGESVTSDSVYSALEFFIRGESSLPNVTLAATKDASEVIKSRTVLDKISSIALHKNLNVTGDKINNISKVTLKDYFINYFSLSKSNLLPYIEIETEKEDKENKNTFFLLSTLLMNGNDSIGILNDKSTRMYNLIHNKRALGYYQVENVLMDNKITTLNFKITNKKIKKKVNITKEGKVVFKLDIDLIVALKDKTSINNTVKELKEGDLLGSDILEEVEKNIIKDVEILFNYSKENNVDIFRIEETLHKYQNRKYKKLKTEELLKETKLELNVNCKKNNLI